MVDGYGTAARRYIAAGWSSPIPLPEGQKWPPPEGVTGRNGHVPDAAQIEAWRAEHPDGNIALRLGANVIGIDIDAYKNPDGVDQLEEMLGAQLPETWCSTSREDGSGIYLYNVPPLPKGKRWKADPVPGVEIIQRGHRYVTCWPSIHPEGRVYHWWDNGENVDAIPTPDDIADLPMMAVGALLKDDPEIVTRDAVGFDLTDGDPSPTVARLLQRGLDACANGAGRHDAVRDAALAIVRAAERDEPGTSPALGKLGSAFADAVAPDRPGGRRHAEKEYADLVDGARRIVATTEPPAPPAQGTPSAAALSVVPVIADELWETRESLLAIRNAAHSRQCSAPLLLLDVLARIAAAVPHTLFLPAPVGAPRPLSLFVAGVAPSGVGKTVVNDNARDYLPITIPTVADQLPLGTGEGLVEAFFEWVKEKNVDGNTEKVKQQTRFGAYYYVDEGAVLADLANRKGATILPTIRAMFSGAQLGSTNADRERRRVINPGFYTVGLFVAFQPRLAGVLLDDQDAGTPQRFVWGHGADPSIPELPPRWPPPSQWEPPQIPTRTAMQVDIAILDEIRHGGLARARGHDIPEPLDSHATLVRYKLAGLLAILERRANITTEDWRLAATIMRYSDAVRASVVAELHQAEQEREDAATGRASRRHVAVIGAEEQHRTVECAKRIAKKVRDEPDRWTRGSLYKWMSNWRDVFDEALEYAIGKCWIVEDIEPGQGDDQRRLRPGPERPS